ncbi:MAG: Asp-tRNA(Asn)/Glu-tRNA(Gln) amidotransferase subunit GatB [Gammaproteobacteria bacterium]|nr:Asp-tRNA(Asn)/Glu-tRNA(Gln) amidotransferase subunit GatB [Gammaproteobacteria bacterium]MBT5863500.1 Asp-tRNA(Asn)/Glu-tRNA(Gln) amidotransferase subunit GatB [Gammaproteobacteria bacterium]MBT6733931.1 Asp-tRNA(Asn)/Glu-tRNA(Gln) amidotransferase subunit GatB [Gammaproteobacteria bacterium]MBT7236944.1 Asp-tRNA(Asn)/Glu-tRNA(Gln) amidotransferase subunit GatB [Gammaproteobacteria bacterium]
MWESVIGLEIHVQLNTKSKIFSPASTDFGAPQNTQACAIDLGMPGVLPVLNEEAVIMAVKFGIAVGSDILDNSIFARKNYFYPDLPKGYQISQYEIPIVSGGCMEIITNGKSKTINLTRAHLEEDAGKSIHDLYPNESAIDLNRAGTPLIEIVSEPEMANAEEAVQYLKNIHSLVRYLGISDGNMQEGSFRCDANISLKKKGSDILGTRAEIKNINSFKYVESAINHEIERQTLILDRGDKVTQETRLYDPSKNETRSMRSKVEANDYRYFPDPDLLPISIDQDLIKSIKDNMPELPSAKKTRFIDQYGLNEYDTIILVSDRDLSEYFENVLEDSNLNPKMTANWIITEVLALAKKTYLSVKDYPVTSDNLRDLLLYVMDETISSKQAKEVFERMWENKENPRDIIENEGMKQISDINELDKIVDNIIKNNYKSVKEYQSGKDKLLGFFVGQVMKETKGQGNPKIVNQLLKEKLKK